MPLGSNEALKFAKNLLDFEAVRHFELHLDNSESLADLADALTMAGCGVEIDEAGLILRVRCPRPDRVDFAKLATSG